METRLCLNGYWDFLPMRDGQSAESVFGAEGWITGRYLVPSSWKPGQDRIYHIFRYPEAWNDVSRGALRRRVAVDYSAGTRVFLRLDAVGQRAEIFANGVKIGETADMFLPVEAEMTGLLRPGSNDVELTVVCDAFPKVLRPDGEKKNLVPAGTWYAGMTRGIWQDAWLVTAGESRILGCFVDTRWREKTVRVTAETEGKGALTLTGLILDAQGEPVLALDESLAADWPDAHPWMPDDPYLYTLRLSLFSDGELSDVFEQRFGFREFRAEGKDFFINDTRLHLRGDAWHYQGLCMQYKSYAENWYRFAKEQGINLIRPHGFPYPQCFYDAADECGMLIMAESAVYGSGKAMQADDPRFLKAEAEHLAAFVRRYRNHPSVCMWSMQNEMRWVNGRESYKKVIPEMMELMHELDPSRRIVSCDGDNRLMEPESMEAVSMHYNIDGLISDWDKRLPLLFGEHGGYHYVAPQGTADLGGQAPYRSFWSAMDSMSRKEALFYCYARREEVTAVTPFNSVNYQNKAMPFEDVELDPGDVTAPGPHPCVAPAWSLPIQNGLLEGYPPYLPQPALRTLRRATAEVTVLPEEFDRSFFADSEVKRRFLVYNDTYRDHEVSVSWTAELESGRVTAVGSVKSFAEAGSRFPVEALLRLPKLEKAEDVTLRFSVRHDGVLAAEDSFTYRVVPALPAAVSDAKILCLGEEGSVPACAAGKVRYVHTPEALARESCDLLILGEELPYTQQELQGVLEKALEEKRIGAVLVLRQTAFVPGDLTLSKRGFFTAHPTGAHPVTDAAGGKELGFWGSGNPMETDGDWLVSDAFDKPAGPGWRVLLECAQGDFGWGGMHWCAMLEGSTKHVPVLLTQLRLQEYVTKVPEAERIYAAAVEYLLKKTVTEKEVLVCTPDSSEHAAECLRRGGSVLLTSCTPEDEKLVGDLLGRSVRIVPNRCWQLCAVPGEFTEGISDADLTGLHHTTYSSASIQSVPAAEFALEAENVTPLFRTAINPWTELFIGGLQAEPLKIAAATRYSMTDHTTACYGFAARVGGGVLAVSQLRPEIGTGAALVRNLLEYRLGLERDCRVFTAQKQPGQHGISRVMWLKVRPDWEYAEAVSYHSSKDYVLNNLGEGSYGWMTRVGAENGTLYLNSSAGAGAFATVFVDCALNHDPEHREEGTIPDPTIVPDLTVKTNRPFRLWCNGVCFADGEKPGTEEVKLTDVLLRKGLNRLFFEFLPGEEDVRFEAIFRDKLLNYLDDAAYLCTID